MWINDTFHRFLEHRTAGIRVTARRVAYYPADWHRAAALAADACAADGGVLLLGLTVLSGAP